MENLDKISIVVIDENALGFIFPETPGQVQVCSARITLGSSLRSFENYPIEGKKIRLAKEKDFDTMMVNFEQFKNPSYPPYYLFDLSE